jgi:hypothetical protein
MVSALIQGVAISMAATRTVAAPVVASVALCWTTALIVQLAGWQVEQDERFDSSFLQRVAPSAMRLTIADVTES